MKFSSKEQNLGKKLNDSQEAKLTASFNTGSDQSMKYSRDDLLKVCVKCTRNTSGVLIRKCIACTVCTLNPLNVVTIHEQCSYCNYI